MGKLADYALIIESRVKDAGLKQKALAVSNIILKKTISGLKKLDDKLSKMEE